MSVKILFQTWSALKDTLADPLLSDGDMDILVDQSMQLIVAITAAPSSSLMDVLLKLEAYGREVEAGPYDECDALLHSALQDRIAVSELLGPSELAGEWALGACLAGPRLSWGRHIGRGLAGTGRGEHRPRPPQERPTDHDPNAPHLAGRGEDPGRPYP